ncbi:MAG: hypothetical protein ABIR96_00185 [Bdellovibrionota bacterium]
MKTKKRLSYLILPDFQWKMVLYAAGLSAFVIVLLYCANLYFFYSLKQEGIAAGLSPTHPFFLFLDKQSRFLDAIFVGVAVVVNIVVILGGLWVSNRIAGPIYRIGTCLAQMTEGQKASKISFRKSDFFGDIVTVVNKVVDRHNASSTSRESQ